MTDHTVSETILTFAAMLRAAKAITCHHSGPPGPLARWNYAWSEKHLGIEHDFKLSVMERRRLIRLRPDYRGERSWRPEYRVDFMTLAAREALTMGHCEVIGGFVRDWIVGGEDTFGAPNDIDLRLWKDFDINQFIERCAKWGLQREDRDERLGFLSPNNQWFFVDYFYTEQVEQDGDLSIDFDVNSLAVSPDLGLHKRAYMERPLSKTYVNVRRKVAYLVENDPRDRCDDSSSSVKKKEISSRVKKLVKKMEGLGWKVIRAESLE